MNYRFTVGIVMMVVVVGCCMAGDTTENKAVQTETTAAGVILEFDHDSPGPKEEKDVASEHALTSGGGRSVEIIVGGQAEEGVAKRREIHVKE